MITLAITHCNRLKYLRALINSLQEFILDYKPQLLMVDNGSVEEGTKEYLQSLSLQWEMLSRDAAQRNWINDEYIAKNWIIGRATHNVILFLQDDAELVVPGSHLADLVYEFQRLPHLAMEIEGVRQATVNRRTGDAIVSRPGVHEKTDPHFPTHGLFKTRILRDAGPYRVDWPMERMFWGRSEDEYDVRLKQHYVHQLLSCIAKVPCFVSIWNDPRGGYAFIRDGRRWGHYRSPVGNRYYMPLSDSQVSLLEERASPSTFLDLAQPEEWQISTDWMGEIQKYPQVKVMEEGPSSPLESGDET